MTLSREELTATLCRRIAQAAPCLLAEFLLPRPVGGFVLDRVLPEAALAVDHKLLGEAMAQPAFARSLASALDLPVDLRSGVVREIFLKPGQGGDAIRPASHLPGSSATRLLDLYFCLGRAWREEEGGHFELSADAPDGASRRVLYRENRLVGVVTGESVWTCVVPVSGMRPRPALQVSFFSEQVQRQVYPEQAKVRSEQRLRSLLSKGNSVLRRVLPGRGTS